MGVLLFLYSMQDSELILLNNRGLFPGPSESQEQFLKRVSGVKNLIVSEAHIRTGEIFDACPDWVEIWSGKKGLSLWEGAATWIEENEKGGRVSSIQLNTSLPSRLYSKVEVIAHEMAHAMRLMFEENRFEEILAFRSSTNRFRRYFGPLFTRSSETKGFILSMVCSWLFYWVELIFDIFIGGEYLLWSPMLILGWGICRLVRSQKIFSKALNQLEKTIKKPGKALAVALRLSDTEIERFATSSPEEIFSFGAEEKKRSLRWKQLFAAYF
jgi:hypothetical protein